MVRFGDSVTFTFQLVDDEGNPVAKSGAEFTVQTEESQDGGRRFIPTTIDKETDSGGRAQVTFRFTDPSNDPGDVSGLDLDVRNTGGLKVSDATTIQMVERDGTSRNDPLLNWTDERVEPTTLKPESTDGLPGGWSGVRLVGG